MNPEQRLAEPRAAVARGDWELALQLLDRDDGARVAGSAEGLELRAQAAYAIGDFEASISAWESLYALLLANGDEAGAASVASTIALHLTIDTGLMSPVRGWLRRAEQLLPAEDVVPAHAVIAMVRTYERFMCGDMAAAREQSARAIELGSRLGVEPAVVVGRVAAARVRLLDGDIDGGLDELDEVGILLMSGTVDPLTTGMMYCELICAAQGLALHDRAAEWTDLMERWRHGAAVGGINGRCRVHRAEILRITGPCELAEEEALRACAELRPWMRREFGWPLVELGNIRLRKGDLAGAEETFVAAQQHGWSPHPGLALLRLEQGDIDLAATLVADAIAHPFAYPSKERPPFGDLRLAPLLDAQAEIAAAAGDVGTARRAAEALDSIAAVYRSRALGGSAALAAARSALLEGDLDRAIDACSKAIDAWRILGAPFEMATSHVVLGDAHHRSGRSDQAQAEWRTAHVGFANYGALRWAARTERLLGEGPSVVPPLPTRAATPATFACEDGMRTVSFGSVSARMPDLKGFRYIERLIADPDREFHVLDLVAVERGSLPTGSPAHDGRDVVVDGTGAGLPPLDDEAREAYRRRLHEVDDDIEEATRFGDLARLELAQRDRDYLIAELKRAVGLGGRHRSVGGTAERARTSVTRSIRYALRRLADHHPSIAAHLERSVQTGTYCSYTSDPLTPIQWHR